MKHRFTITVPSYLCRPDDTLHIDGLAALMGEAAWQHARQFGVAFTEEEIKQFWILHRLGFRVIRAPRWGDEITIETWPSRVQRLFAMREFVIRDRDGAPVVEASSSWIIVDSGTRRPVRPDNHLSPEWRVDEVPIEMPTGKLAGLDHQTATALLADARWHPVRESDIDRNGHVNNARYVQWIEDEVGGDGVSRDPSRILTVSFLNETLLNREYAVVGAGDSGPIEVWTRPIAPADTDTGSEANPTDSLVCACRFTAIEL